MSLADRISGYSHVNVLVTDLDAAHDFYIDKLGFSVLPRPDFGGFRGAWYQIGDLQLHLSVVEEMPDLKGGFPHIAFYIPADRFDQTIDELKSDGVPFVMDTMAREDFGVPVRAAFCKDPDGNVVELTDVGPL
jgi:catechol 2,3-dioxygenase-like lactoylglutathione lyase family enzyme